MGRPSPIPIALGERFGRLTVIERAEPTSSGLPRFKCRCDCGRITQPRAANLRNGATKSCGCLQKERASKCNTKDITGQRFGRLVALYPTGERRKDRVIVWRLRCDCGKEIEHSIHHLGGDTKSCGCLRKEATSKRFRFAKELTGQRFGRLTVICRVEPDRWGKAQFKCRCDCGKITQTSANELQRGGTKSCGCYKKEVTSKRQYRHGGSKSLFYDCWIQIKERCFKPKNKSFKHYGERGITMAPEWINDFQAFRDYVNQNLGPRPSPKHSIDRIENYEGYFPGNLRWASPSQQQYNSRRSRIDKIVNTVLLECVTGL
jgi:hypothetical protein